MSKFTDRLWRDLVREHGTELAQLSRPAAKSPKKLPGLRPRLAAAGAVVGLVALNATGAFGLNVLGMHSALTATSLPGGFQSASTANYITPTGTTCTQVKNGTATPLTTPLTYTLNKTGTKILGVNPGVFFYWFSAGSSPPGSTDTLTIKETVNPSGYALIPIASGSAVFDANCNKVKTQSITYNSTTGITTITFKETTSTEYFIGVKYNPSALAGNPPPTGGTATYTFTNSLGGSAMISLKKK